jgi:hypothetical protein
VNVATFFCVDFSNVFLHFLTFLPSARPSQSDSKGNMLNGQTPRVRERIPTPENDNRLNGHSNINNNNINNPFSNIQSIATGVALTAQNLATNPSIFPSSNNVPILGTLLLSPIKESDSVNNTLSSSSLAPSKSILPLNYKSTNTQFGSLVIPSSSHQDLDSNMTSSFVMLPSSSSENEIIPVTITTVPLTITTTSNQSVTTGAIITELPFDQTDFNLRSAPATPRLGILFGDSPVMSPALKHKIQRQQSVESNRSGTADNVSTSSNSTLTKRPGGSGGAGPGSAGGAGGKHSEVYV